MNHQGFGFCEFLSEDDADYACKIMNQIKLYGKPIRVNKASYDTKKPVDVGANLFIGSLDEGVDENALFDTFSTFGSIAEHPKVSPSVKTHYMSLVACTCTERASADLDRSREIQRQADQKVTDSCRITISRRPTWLWRI